jgi:uncharacterized LabA/DUF88 family protein
LFLVTRRLEFLDSTQTEAYTGIRIIERGPGYSDSMNETLHHGDDVALFIDWENFKISLAAGHRNPNVSALREEVSNYGRVVVAKAYADWVTRAPELKGASQFINDPPALYAAGIEPVYVPTRLPQGSTPSESYRTARVKNSVDVKMTADCIECAHSYSNIGTYVLVSGDSDFIHVINTLRTMGKRVVIIGVSWSTSRRLADQADGLILYDADVDPPVTPAEPAPPSNGRAASRPSTTGRPDLTEVIRIIEDIVRSERQAGRTTLLTSLKQRLMRRIPGFDEKKLGFSGFKKLMQRVAQEGNVKLVTVGLVDWVIMGDEPDFQEPLAESPDADATIPAEVEAIQEASATLEAPLEERGGARGQTRHSRNGKGKRTKSLRKKAKAAKTEAPALELATVMADSIAQMELPEGPDDGQDAQRIADLIVMADTLEHREGGNQVAFNFLVSEVCLALEEGLKAGQEEITQHWGQTHSRTYVTKLTRSLANGGIFQRGWHTSKDQDSGRSRRHSTFNLNRSHPLVQKVLEAQWETSTSGNVPPEELTPDVPKPPVPELEKSEERTYLALIE